jgi:outer membrane receptor protein involved in Fe transport
MGTCRSWGAATGRVLVRASLAAALAACLHTAPVTAQSVPTTEASTNFNLPPGDLAGALDRVSTQTGIQLMYQPAIVAGLHTKGLTGLLTWREALDKLLQGTGLEYHQINATTVVVRPSGTDQKRGAQATTPSSEAHPGEKMPIANIEAMTVTGTRIRGGATPSPVITIGAENIREEGFTDLGEVIRSVPQNFSGGQNPEVVSSAYAGANVGNANVTGGSSLNLRGLGSDATLTLLNGRRMSYDSNVQAVDISAIPVDAVDRLEIVADGASAIYGSDAVGGVGNVILKRDFEGLTVGASYGTSADGGATSREYTATGGAVWSSGGFIATYKKASVDPIYTSQRSFTDDMIAPSTIYPGSDLHSGLLSVHQSLGDVAEVRLDAMRTERDQLHYYQLTSGIFPHFTPRTTTQLVSPSVEFWLPHDWSLTASATRGYDDHIQHATQESMTSGSPTIVRVIDFTYENDSRTYETGAEGPLFALSGGDARLALGIGYRTSGFRQLERLTGVADLQGHEGARSTYAELDLPLIGQESNITGAHRLELTAAARSENYDSFGRVTTPKLGLIYEPTVNFTLKTSWGKSFKAPTLFQRFYPVRSLLTPITYGGGTGFPADATMLILDGGNPNLKPERARTQSVSLELHPESLSGLEMELTWFDIDYKNRVIYPFSDFSHALIDPMYSNYIVYSPTAEQQAELIEADSDQKLEDFAGAPYDPNKVAAIVFSHWVNAIRQRIKGVDWTGSYRLDLGSAQMTVRGSLSRLDSSQRTEGSAQPYDLAGTLFNPAKINSRLGVVWNQGGITASVFANYKSGVKDTVMDHMGGSFTTFDGTLHYSTGVRNDALSELDLALSAQNLFNRAPPLYAPLLPLYVAPYDSTNYSAIGRFISLSVSKHW